MSSYFDPQTREVVEKKFITREWTLMRTAEELSLNTMQVLAIARDIRYYSNFLSAWAT
jgi:hypothetical protein